MSSQNSATPPGCTIPPVTTPATSTPKSHPLTLGVPPSSSTGNRRVPLKFVSGGDTATRRPKASQAVSSIVLGKNSRIIQGKVSMQKCNSSALKNVAQSSTSSTSNSAAKPRFLSSISTRSRSELTTQLKSGLTCSSGNGPEHATKSTSVCSRNSSDQRESDGDGKAKDRAVKKTSNLSTRASRQSVNERQKVPYKIFTNDDRKTVPNQNNNPTIRHTPATTQMPPITTQTTSTAQASQPQAKSSTHHLKNKTQFVNMSSYQEPVKSAPTVARFNKANVTTDHHTEGTTLPRSPIEVYDDFTDANIGMRCEEDTSLGLQAIVCQDSYVPTEERSTHLKSSPSKKQLNNSVGSSASATSSKSRTALSDVTSTCLNRGNQRRVFNLSAVPKKKEKGNKKPKFKSASNSSSLNSTLSCEHDLNAIPDSLPTQRGRTSSVSNTSKTQNNTSNKRKYKRVCMPVKYNDTSLDDTNSDNSLDSNMDVSWELSPPKQKKMKKPPASPKHSTFTKQKSSIAKKADKKVILTSARTKKGPNAKSRTQVSSFEITESDFELDLDGTKPKQTRERVAIAKRKMKTSADCMSPQSAQFRELETEHQKIRLATEPGSGNKKNETSRRPTIENSTLKNDLISVPSISESRSNRNRRSKRLLDTVYDLPLSPPEPTSSSIPLNKTERLQTTSLKSLRL